MLAVTFHTLVVIFQNYKGINIEAVHKYRPLIKTSDYELLRLINSSSNSQQAFEEFYLRFKVFVSNVCRKCCSGFDNGNMLADDIFKILF